MTISVLGLLFAADLGMLMNVSGSFMHLVLFACVSCFMECHKFNRLSSLDSSAVGGTMPIFTMQDTSH